MAAAAAVPLTQLQPRQGGGGEGGREAVCQRDGAHIPHGRPPQTQAEGHVAAAVAAAAGDALPAEPQLARPLQLRLGLPL